MNYSKKIVMDNLEVDQKFRLEPLEQKEYLINGELREWSGNFQKVFATVCQEEQDEITPKYIGSYPILGENEALESLDAAVVAFDKGRGEWPQMAVSQRIDHLKKFTYKMQEVREKIINLLMWEIGKPYSASAKEFDRTVDYIQDTIDALKQLDRDSSRFEIKDGIIGQIRRSPLGVVLCMGPYNYPLNETFTTLIPALIMGNTVIFKPPRFGVLLHQPLLKAFCESFPKGVVNTVYGDGPTVIGPIMQSGKIDVLAFIGSSTVADILKKQHPAPHRMRSVLGLEAKNAGIFLEDCDLDLSVQEALTGALSYNGQRCTALKILFVHKNIVSAFLEKYVDGVNKLKRGGPWVDKVDITSLPDMGWIDHLKGMISDAVNKGAKVLNPHGGESFQTFLNPAVLYPVNETMEIYSKEQFGPVVPIVPFDDLKEPIDYVVNSNYGQQVSIFSNDSSHIASLVDIFVHQVCRVNINGQCQRGPDTFPFTGRKDSAEGTLSVSDALKVFAIRTLVAFKDEGKNKKVVTEVLQERKSSFLSTDYIF